MKSLSRWKPLRSFLTLDAIMAVCLFALTSCSSPAPPTLDSAGGVVLEFSIDETNETESSAKDMLARSVKVILARLDPYGTRGIAVRVTEQNRLEVSLPGNNAEEQRRAIDLITRLGTLEFAVVANPRDHKSLIESALQNPYDKDEVEVDGAVVAVWLSLTDNQQENQMVDFPESLTATRTFPRGKQPKLQQYLIIRDLDDERVTGQFLKRVWAGIDEQGQACVNLTFDEEGAQRLKLLTHRYSPAADGYKRRMAIVFDGQIHSAPNINGVIAKDCQITGKFSREEIDSLVTVLNSGVLETPLNPTPVSKRFVSPKKGVPANKVQ